MLTTILGALALVLVIPVTFIAVVLFVGNKRDKVDE